MLQQTSNTVKNVGVAGIITAFALLSPEIHAATDLTSAVEEMKTAFEGAVAPAFSFVVAALTVWLGPKILIRIFHMAF